MDQIDTTPPRSSAGSLTESLERLAPYVLSIVRIMVALLFLEHGLAKLFGFPQQPTPPPELFSLVWFSGAIELVGGALAAVGLFTRAAAFIMSGEMAVGYFMAHAPQSFFPLSTAATARSSTASFFFICFSPAPDHGASTRSFGGGRGRPCSRWSGAKGEQPRQWPGLSAAESARGFADFPAVRGSALRAIRTAASP